VKAKVFEVILHKLLSGKSPASAPEEQLNVFLAEYPKFSGGRDGHEHDRRAGGTKCKAQFRGSLRSHFLNRILHGIDNARY